jgi:small GTP-binding protein
VPANLPPQYFEVEKRYREAKDPEERLLLLRELLSIIPKHKGTEKLQADLKRKISKLGDQLQSRKKSGRRMAPYRVEPEGAARVALVGGPNSGKSSLLAALTNASPQIASYPFTTRLPQPGMIPYQDIQIQLVDLPPLCQEYREPWVFDLIRGSDLLLLIADLGEPTVEQVKYLLQELEARSISKPSILVGNKVDRDNEGREGKLLKEAYVQALPIIFVSTVRGDGLEILPGKIFSGLNLVRVYSKVPGKKPDIDQPFVFTRGTTVMEVAMAIHKEVAARFRYARIWGEVKPEGIMVPMDYQVKDRDILEIHHT